MTTAIITVHDIDAKEDISTVTLQDGPLPRAEEEVVVEGTEYKVIEVVHDGWPADGQVSTSEVTIFAQQRYPNKTIEEPQDQLLRIVANLSDTYNKGAPLAKILDRAQSTGLSEAETNRNLEQLLQKGLIFQPRPMRYRENARVSVVADVINDT